MLTPPSFRRKPAALLSLCLLSLAAQAQSGFTDLGTLGGTTATAYGISADGAVVVGRSTYSGVFYHAFRWTSGGGMVDLGTLGGSYSQAMGVSADGAVVVGRGSLASGYYHAVRWTSGGGKEDLGTLGGLYSEARGVSADGAVVVGSSLTGSATHAFRYTSGGMVDLGTLGGTDSAASGVSADGTVVVGQSDVTGNSTFHAYRWTSGGMVDLGTLGGAASAASGVSADGTVVVGMSYLTGDSVNHAFRWTSGGGMADLGTLGGWYSRANGLSADGKVVVGESLMADDATQRGFRWTQATGMQTVENWLRASGVTVPADVTAAAYGTNSDGSVVVGELTSGVAFIARAGSGLVTQPDVQDSLGAASVGGAMVLRSVGTVVNGAHSNPLMRRVGAGQNNFWIAGDWGRDDHGARDGDLGLAEIGLGRNFGPLQLNVSVGQTWATQNLLLNGRAKTEGSYLLAEALVPLAGNFWGTLGAYSHRGHADLRRGYLNVGVQDYSTASPAVDTQGLRARIDWDKAFQAADAEFSPYADLSQTVSKLGAYTESGGGFPARFDSRKEKATELRLGANGSRPIAGGMNLAGTLEAAHRFEKTGARTSVQLIGLPYSFNLDGENNKQDWMRARLGVEGKLAEGTASVAINLTTQGGTPSAWLAVNWQKAF